MTDEELKLECLKLGMAGQSHLTINNAQVYYDWVKKKDEPPKRMGRPPKKDVDAKQKVN